MGYILGLILMLSGTVLTAVPQAPESSPNLDVIGLIMIVVGIVLLFLNYTGWVPFSKEFTTKELRSGKGSNKVDSAVR